ncbi:chemotaxis signal transduction histidine kinase CheA [Oleiphilus messinensis]|uniref:Chemotaxis protein CheA n=1 Tax=Oleiphilus messinensis TaxID=141451 RepID=A0A1Y0IDX1_9GAMM|nr:chemotaxis protein CheA [Oleiphilus messinensis]ARU57583.1 chemotaxis signal transduction histidine kinase CheA [Oleiphilus messinensis]
MGIDLSQFHQVFFEESLEGLDVMESALLDIDLQSYDDETINEIFRAAHSIKGGAGTFGFSAVAEFTHVLETLLDQIRSGDRPLLQEHVDLFLQSVDCVRRMIQALQSGDSDQNDEADELKIQFEKILSGASASNAPQDITQTPGNEVGGAASEELKAEEELKAQSGQPDIWKIFFKPDPDILKTGNEPLRMFRELEEFGALEVVADVSSVPAIGAIEPELCYLAWTLKLTSESATQEQIEEVFEWVIDDAELTVARESTETVEEREMLAGEGEGEGEGEGQLNQPEAAAQLPDATPATTVVPEAASDVPISETTEPEISAPIAAKTPANKTSDKSKADKTKTEVSSIRVGIDKIDSLINMVGELVITQSMLGELSRDFDMDKLPKLLEGLEQLSQNTRELQESVMRIRMLPISFTFSRFPRLVHDLSRNLGKKIELKLLGEQTELDKTVMEKIGDPMVHLVRNSLDHGIETPADRIAAGKSETGTIILNAYHQGGNIVIQIIDDGKGLDRDRILRKAVEKGLVGENDKLSDEQIYDLVFKPGFSTAEQVTDISGRGVGMDVVRRNIQELNGSVEVESVPGEGSTFTIRLPLTLAILDGQLVRSGEHTYILPLISIIESIQTDMTMIHRVAGGCDVLRLRNEYVPVIRLYDIFNIRPDSTNLEDSLLVVVEGDNMKVALVVDDLLAQQQVVIKSLEENYKRVEGVSGATILGDGTVALILDISGLIKLAGVRKDDYKVIKNEGDRAA